mmetsp:Transcript_14778/g.33949  ORF Transcript_14778/g.33949 Transcript_14778/m.33949 type:complete len:276 (-) Transcript_14778:73-900(-)
MAACRGALKLLAMATMLTATACYTSSAMRLISVQPRRTACRVEMMSKDEGKSLRTFAASSLVALGITLSGDFPSVAATLPDLKNTPLSASKVSIVLEGIPRVVDGDTLVFPTKDGQKDRVRLLGIDAPESRQTCKDEKGFPYACGLESKTYLQDLIKNDVVKCVAEKRDMYSRVLGICFDEKTGVQINQNLVDQGEALAYQQYSKAYVMNEEHAKSEKRGVWKGAFQEPWQYRKDKRSKQPSTSRKAPANEISKVSLSGNKPVSSVEDFDGDFEE